MRAMLAIAVVAGAFLALWPTTLSLSERWADTVTRAYTHGSLVPLIVAFLIWRRRDLLAKAPSAPSFLALAGGLLAGIAWLIAVRGGLQIVHQALLPVIVAFAVWAALGVAVLRVLALPLAYLYFTVPLWDALNPALQWLSAFAVRGLLSIINIPVYFDGLNFQIPEGVFHIAGGCSGLHFFIVAAAVAVFYGELHRDRLGTRIRLLALALGFALVTNWVRIAIIIYFGHKTDMQHHLVADEHYSFGWGMFAVAMVIYFLIVRRWQAAEDAQPIDSSPAIDLPKVGVLAAFTVLALPAAWYWLDTNRFIPTDTPEVTRREHEARNAEFDSMQTPGPPQFAQADFRGVTRATIDGQPTDRFEIWYLEQAQGRELAGYANKPEGLDLQRLSRVIAPDSQHVEIKARDAAGQDWLIWMRYEIDGRSFVDTLSASVYYGALSLWRDPWSVALLARSPCLPDCPAARSRLERVLERHSH